MPRFYLRFALLPIIIFTAALLLIHAQPYDDHELRELLLPEGCPAPCFMGIRPGVTKMSQIVKTSDKKILDIQFRTLADSEVVDSIVVKTTIPFGDIFLLLGGGRFNEHFHTYGQTATRLIGAIYPELQLGVYTEAECPISKLKYWNTLVNLAIVSSSLFKSDDLMVCPIDY